MGKQKMLSDEQVEGVKKLIDQLEMTHHLSEDEWEAVIDGQCEITQEYARKKAEKVRQEIYGRDVFTRGLIEFTNYCKNDCYYCGIRRGNSNAKRYRLTKEEILSCCEQGYELGFRTFVLQGGEDPYYTDDKIVEVVREIRNQFQDCAITLSIGEKQKESYQRFFDAGADRYLLRHETACEKHYETLHPKELTLQHRQECLYRLKDIGYQVGCGFMVGSPGQTSKTLVKDMLFIKRLQPHMVGIGPFIPHHDTPLRAERAGTLEQTLYLLSLIRLLHPKVLLPATTALGTIHGKGRELGILAGANVVMPNLSPTSVRKNYELYDNKICTGDEAAECRACLSRRMEGIGYQLVVSRGDFKN